MIGNKTIFLLLLAIILIAWFAGALSQTIRLQKEKAEGIWAAPNKQVWE